MIKILFRIVLALAVLAPAPAPRAFAAPKDCIVCGHQCCCPEQCAQVMEEIRAEARRVGDVGCGPDVMRCRVGATRGNAAAAAAIKELPGRPSAWLEARVFPARPAFDGARVPDGALPFFPQQYCDVPERPPTAVLS